MTARQRTWEILSAAKPDDRASRAFDIALLVLICLNVAAVIAETVPEVREGIGTHLAAFESLSVAVFSIEYLARLWSAPADPHFRGALRGRLRWAITPMALVDLLAVLPAYLPLLGVDLRVARALRLLRIFRVAKLWRYVGALRLFGDVARSKREELVLTTFVVALLLVIGSAVAVLGVGLFALPTAILGSGFVEEIGRRREPPRCPHCGEALHG